LDWEETKKFGPSKIRDNHLKQGFYFFSIYVKKGVNEKVKPSGRVGQRAIRLMGERSPGARVKTSNPTAGLPKRKGVIMHKRYMSISMGGQERSSQSD
jgi:hypothetical protein